MTSPTIPKSFLLTETTFVAIGGVHGYANSPEYNEIVAPTAQVEVYNGPIPSELAVQRLHKFLGVATVSSVVALHTEVPSEEDNECPPTGHPDATSVVPLNNIPDEPLCRNENPWNLFDNSYFCPNGTKNAGTVYDMSDPQGYAQCSTHAAVRPAPTATPTPDQAALSTTEDTPSSSSGAGMWELLMGAVVVGGLVYAFGPMMGKRKR